MRGGKAFHPACLSSLLKESSKASRQVPSVPSAALVPAASPSSPNPKVPSGYTYIEESDQDLICSICLEPLNDPVSHSICGNMFCQDAYSSGYRPLLYRW